MKIAMPVDGKNMESDVCISFGRAPYFLFYDTQTKEGVFVENSAAQDQGGAGIKAAQAIVDRGAEVLVTPRCGENAAQVLKAAGIKMMKSIQGSALENINAFTEEKLALLDEIHPGFHGHGDGQA
jgi:predicted Fe-Mo cluster-binding NifX family protein